MNISKLLGVVCGAGLLLGHKVALADIAIGTSGVTVNFNGFNGSGFAATPATGQLNSSDWQILGFSDGSLLFDTGATSGDYARGATAVAATVGGVYALNAPTNPALGVKPDTDDFTPGTITARFTNSSGHTLIKLGLAYNVVFRNSTARSNSLNFAWSLDNATWNAEAALNFTTAAAAAGGWDSDDRTVNITTSIATNGKLYLRWSGDDPGTGDVLGDEIGIDDIVISLQNGCGDGIAQSPEACDDGNSVNTDNCLNTCVQAFCGDDIVRSSGTNPEQCDGSVCCSNSCTKLTGTTCRVGNQNGTCNNGTCSASSSGTAGEGGETGTAGDSSTAGDTGSGGDNEGGATTGGTGGRGGRGGRGGMGGETGGMPAGGTAGATAGGTSGAGTGGVNGGTAGTTSTGGAGAAGKAGSSGAGGSAGKAGAASAGTSSKPKPSSDDKDDSGCGCSVPHSSNHGTLALAMAGALVTLMRRRRRAGR